MTDKKTDTPLESEKHSSKTEEEVKTLLQAFDSCLKALKDGLFIYKSRNQRIEELASYALILKKKYNRSDRFKVLLIDMHIYALKEYFERIGIFFSYNVKTDFLKVFTDSEGLFNKTDNIDLLLKYTDFLKEKREEAKKSIIKDEAYYKDKLLNLFKGKKEEEVKAILKAFIK